MSSSATELKRKAARTIDAGQKPERRVLLMGCPADLITSADLLAELSHVIDTQAGPKVIQFINANKIAQVRDRKSVV